MHFLGGPNKEYVRIAGFPFQIWIWDFRTNEKYCGLDSSVWCSKPYIYIYIYIYLNNDMLYSSSQNCKV
jgi:hypothetical protein